MKIKDIKILLLLLCGLATFTACDETSESGEYDNWQQRNMLYIDSIAAEARANADGDWKVFLADGLEADGEAWSNEYYVYCKVLQQGDGTVNPHYNDSVLVNYRGRLIPTRTYKQGYVFAESYDGDFDAAVDVPVKLSLSGCVRGWKTAMQHMVQGDTWRIYVPANLGYSTTEMSGIPSYSTLVFDINLVRFAPVGTPLEVEQ